MTTIEIVMVPVTDQQTAKEFYVKLGFQVQVESPMPNGETWLQLGLPNGGATIALMKQQAIIFETDDIKKEMKAFNAHGIEVGEIDKTPWGQFAWLKDPDGNAVCLHQR